MNDLTTSIRSGPAELIQAPWGQEPPVLDRAIADRTARLDTILRQAKDTLSRAVHDANAISAWAAMLVYVLNHRIQELAEHATREALEHHTENAVLALCMDVLQRTAIDRAPVLETILASAAAACQLNGAGPDPFARLREFHRYTDLLRTPRNSGPRSCTANAQPIARVVWTGRGKLEELVHQLMTLKLINSKSLLFDLFSTTRYPQVRIHWDMARKAHLAHLWHQLYNKGLIQAVASKGYFAFAEAHFTGLNGEVLHRNSLKRISSTITLEPDRFPTAIKDVERILSLVAR